MRYIYERLAYMDAHSSNRKGVIRTHVKIICFNLRFYLERRRIHAHFAYLKIIYIYIYILS